ncbi:MAG TPA: hypothetical protein VFQ91_25490 [Bryobacteraceae bacterium]|nr:hypothetical protein [Bryobacteraceae bacterium]
MTDDSPDPVETLRRATIPSRLIEDFRPLAESLEWRLSEAYWLETGTKAFIEQSVPYSATSGGTLAQDAAALLLANCRDDPPSGPFAVLELCAGSGLFARLLVDSFRRQCIEAGETFHEQMTFLATDRSPATLAQWSEFGVWDGVNVTPALGDARRPLDWLTPDGPVRLHNIRAVFCNYGLDSLPAAIVRRGESGPEELCLRSHYTADEARRRRYGSPSIEELQQRAERADPGLLHLGDLFEVEATFLPSRPFPLLDEALAIYGSAPRVIWNYGAMECLAAILPALHRSGFFLVNDYGIVDGAEPVTHSTPQRFGSSKALGLHFPILGRFVETLGAEWLEPDTFAGGNLHPRLIVRSAAPRTRAVFSERLGHSPWAQAGVRAQSHVRAGALEEARAVYMTALSHCRRDWALLGETAEFLIRQADDPEAGLELAKSALALNPWYSTWLWNVYGDAYYALQRYPEALAAYKIAEEKSPRDVRTQVNLSYAYAALENNEDALVAIGRGFAHDTSGDFRDRLRDKQQQILGAIRARAVDSASVRERWAKRMNAV